MKPLILALALLLVTPGQAAALSVQHQRDAITNTCGAAGGAIFYKDLNWSGYWRVLCFSQKDLRATPWTGTPYHMNDNITSLYVWGRTVSICRDIDYFGGCRYYPSGSGDLDLRQYGWNDVASSVRF